MLDDLAETLHLSEVDHDGECVVGVLEELDCSLVLLGTDDDFAWWLQLTVLADTNDLVLQTSRPHHAMMQIIDSSYLIRVNLLRLIAKFCAK